MPDIRIISRSKIKLCIESSFQELEEVWDKLRSMIESDMEWNIMFGENMNYKQFSQIMQGNDIYY